MEVIGRAGGMENIEEEREEPEEELMDDEDL